MSRPAEDQHLEWKESWRDEHLKIVCAFANSQGGVLEIGRNDEGKVVGLQNATRLIEKLRLAEGEYLKRAAVLLFHPDPKRFITGAFIKIGYFETESDLRYHDEVHGDLFTQVDKTMDLLLLGSAG